MRPKRVTEEERAALGADPVSDHLAAVDAYGRAFDEGQPRAPSIRRVMERLRIAQGDLARIAESFAETKAQKTEERLALVRAVAGGELNRSREDRLGPQMEALERAGWRVRAVPDARGFPSLVTNCPRDKRPPGTEDAAYEKGAP